MNMEEFDNDPIKHGTIAPLPEANKQPMPADSHQYSDDSSSDSSDPSNLNEFDLSDSSAPSSPRPHAPFFGQETLAPEIDPTTKPFLIQMQDDMDCSQTILLSLIDQLQAIGVTNKQAELIRKIRDAVLNVCENTIKYTERFEAVIQDLTYASVTRTVPLSFQTGQMFQTIPKGDDPAQAAASSDVRTVQYF